MVIIKDGKIAENDWEHIADDQALPENGVTVSLKRWRAERDRFIAREVPIGIRLGADEAPEDIAEDLGYFRLIVLEVSSFTDGRTFSQARLLRDRYGYSGELRVRGDFLRDQVFFLARVGVNAFEPADGTTPETLLPALAEFTVRYQAASDIREPLYRRR